LLTVAGSASAGDFAIGDPVEKNGLTIATVYRQAVKMEPMLPGMMQQSDIHLAAFIGFLALIILPLWLPEPAEHAALLDSFTRFVNYAMWGLWFSSVFLSVIATGRSWSCE
jgi:hypothetical protein